MSRPKVYVKPKAWSTMSLWARLGGKKSREFTCFGRAIFEHGVFCVTDVYLIKQEGSSGGVDGDEEDINRLMVELYQRGIEPDEAFRCWIHSHPGSGSSATYLSSTDEENIDRYLTGAFLISIVLDKNGDHPYCRVDLKEPRWSVEADLEVDLRLEDDERKAAEEEFDEKSKAKVYTTSSSWIGGRGYHSSTSSGRGSSSSGKANGAAARTGGGAARGGTSNGGAGQPERDYDEMDLFLYGLSEEDVQAWREYNDRENASEAGVPQSIVQGDTDEIAMLEIDMNETDPALSVTEISPDAIPEWVVSMADEMAITVEDLEAAVDLDSYDRFIDEIVRAVQYGHKTMDAGVDALVKAGISKDVATKEIELRANA